MEDILSWIIQEIHTVVMATVDEKGYPITCAIDLMLAENDKLYFLTARGKSFYHRLIQKQYLSFTGVKGNSTLTSIAVSFQGKVKNIGHDKLDEIFVKNSYMKEIYPDEKARDVLEVFEIYEGKLEVFDLRTKPIQRKTLILGNTKQNMEIYEVQSSCTVCTLCFQHCPQKCIDIKHKPVIINQKHCLHCGKCLEICPEKAIIKKSIIID